MSRRRQFYGAGGTGDYPQCTATISAGEEVGDTLAKWYEAVVLAPQPETLPLTVRLEMNNAQAIRDVLLNSSEQALSDQQNQQLTQSFCDVVDAITAGGGMVGGLGRSFYACGGGSCRA